MGNRVSISFKKDGEESVVLFDHWGGMSRVKHAKEYAKKLKEEVGKGYGLNPLNRLEPNTVMVDYIRYITKDLDKVWHSLYLGKTPKDGDNSDNGHHIIDFDDL